ncbi:MAG: bacillithiol system redox-active protein YtxJ [Chitinophagaceae bacterium]|nr:bacillithiol system redox-active protein YtxJ [Chitinophagaceae bacterium]
MTWIDLTNEQQLEDLKVKSKNTPQVIFKHSTRCSISTMAKNRLDRSAHFSEMDFNYLDLLKYRNLSSKIENDFKVRHESPQILLVKDGICIYDESHSGIDMGEIIEQSGKN